MLPPTPSAIRFRVIIRAFKEIPPSVLDWGNELAMLIFLKIKQILTFGVSNAGQV
jgi:hypothetical protein